MESLLRKRWMRRGNSDVPRKTRRVDQISAMFGSTIEPFARGTCSFPLLASSGQIATRVRINAMFFALLACTALYKVIFYATLFDVYFLLPRGFEITADLWDAAPVFSFQALVSVVDAPFLLHGSVDHTML